MSDANGEKALRDLASKENYERLQKDLRAVKEDLSHLADQVSDAVSGLGNNARRQARAGYRQARRTMDSAMDEAGRQGGAAMEAAQDMAESLEETLEDAINMNASVKEVFTWKNAKTPANTEFSYRFTANKQFMLTEAQYYLLTTAVKINV